MSDWTRRTVLGLGASGLAALAGCLADDQAAGATGSSPKPTPDQRTPTDRRDDTTPEDGTPEDGPSGKPVETLSLDGGDPLRRVQAGFPQRDVAAYYLAVLTSERHAGAFPTDRLGSPEAASFLTETDYSRAAVVVVHDRRGSSVPDLELRETGRTGRTLTVTAAYLGRAGTADITPNTLLVRVPTTEPVRAAQATLRPQYGDPVRFSTANSYDVLPRFDPPGAVVVRNRDCADHRASLTLTYRGDLFLRERVEVISATERTIGGVIAYAGEWTLTADVDGTTTTRTVSVTDNPPADLVIGIDTDGTPTVTRQSVDDLPPLDGCDAGTLPYESPTPAENVDPPADLLVLDDSDDAHSLSVTINDGSAAVFDRSYDTAAGEDKIRQSAVLAKQTTYTVTVTTENGTTTTETVTLETGGSTLLVRLTEDGGLAVSLS